MIEMDIILEICFEKLAVKSDIKMFFGWNTKYRMIRISQPDRNFKVKACKPNFHRFNCKSMELHKVFLPESRSSREEPSRMSLAIN